MAVNKDRLWFVVTQMVGDENWADKAGTLAGCFIENPANLVRFNEVMQSDTRDALVVCPDSIMIVQPKSTQKLGLIAGFRAMRGNTKGLGETFAVAKRDVISVEVLDHVPGARVQGVPCARVRLRSGDSTRDILFAIDTHTNAIGGFAGNVADWLAGGG